MLEVDGISRLQHFRRVALQCQTIHVTHRQTYALLAVVEAVQGTVLAIVDHQVTLLGQRAGEIQVAPLGRVADNTRDNQFVVKAGQMIIAVTRDREPYNLSTLTADLARLRG